MARELTTIDDLTPDVRNANLGTERGRYMLEQSIREVGAGRSIVVAAEQTGRLCFGMEISEAYVAVALQRLQDMGLEPRLTQTYSVTD